MIKQGRCCAFELYFCKHTHRYWTSISHGMRELEREREIERGRERKREGASLWEMFVTGVTAWLDGWAASIWLQCM